MKTKLSTGSFIASCFLSQTNIVKLGVIGALILTLLSTDLFGQPFTVAASLTGVGCSSVAWG